MVIFTTDDVCPEFLDYWKKYLDPVHKKYPNFKVLAFVTPYWHEKEINNVKVSKGFYIWKKDREDWVEVANHGLNHLTTECTASYHEQLEMMKQSKKLLDTDMFKPPYYKWNSDSLFAAKVVGFRWFFTQDGVLDLNKCNFYPRQSLGLLDSHCNPECDMTDRLDRVEFEKFMMGSIFANRLGGDKKDETR